MDLSNYTYLELLDLRTKVNKEIINYDDKEKIEVYKVSEYGESIFFINPQSAWDYVNMGGPELMDLFLGKVSFDIQKMTYAEAFKNCDDLDDEIYVSQRIPEVGAKIYAYVSDLNKWCEGIVLKTDEELGYLTNGIPFDTYKYKID
jgi:adenine-specific DNA methylase